MSYFLSSKLGEGFWPGLIVPAAILLVALVSAAIVLYVTYVRPGSEPGRGR